jgi:hypothetical protein
VRGSRSGSTPNRASSFDLTTLQTQELVEDNGWPNLEGRLSFGFGAPAERAGGRQLRPLELGVSGVVGQLRVLDNIRSTDPLTLRADRSLVTVWGSALNDQLRVHAGYGIDTAADSGRFGLSLNSTAFANLVWDVNPWLQLGLEANYKFTSYDRFGDKDAWVVISQLLLRL